MSKKEEFFRNNTKKKSFFLTGGAKIDKVDEILKEYFPKITMVSDLIFSITNIPYFKQKYANYLTKDKLSKYLNFFADIQAKPFDENNKSDEKKIAKLQIELKKPLKIRKKSKMIKKSSIKKYTNKLFEKLRLELNTDYNIIAIQNYYLHNLTNLDNFVSDWLSVFSDLPDYKVEESVTKSIDLQKPKYIYRILNGMNENYLKCFTSSEYMEKFLIMFIDKIIITIENNKTKILPKDLIGFLPPGVSPANYVKKYFDDEIKPLIKETSQLVPSIIGLFIQNLEFARKDLEFTK